jgi:hypothetical protein
LEFWGLSLTFFLILSRPSFGQNSKVLIESTKVYRDSICLSLLISTEKNIFPIKHTINNSFIFFWGHLKPPLIVISFIGTTIRGHKYSFYPPLSYFKIYPKFNGSDQDNSFQNIEKFSTFEKVDSIWTRQRITILTPGRNSRWRRILNKWRYGKPKVWVNLILDWEKDQRNVDAEKLPY